MKSKLYMTLALSVALGFTACDENEQFEGELYKKVIYLLSDTDLSFSSVHELGAESTGYVTVYCGGTEHIMKDVTVELEPDDEVLSEYNRLNYDIDSSRFAKELEPSRYTIESFTTVLRADNPDNYSLLPIKVRPDGLSPDSIYMIPLRIKSVSDYEINPDKQSVLFRIILKNKYATMASTTYYQMTGTETRHNADGDVASGISVTRIFAPLGKNSVRTFAGTTTYNPANVTVDEINKYAIIITVNDDNSVTVSPYGTIEVEMLGEPEENSFTTNTLGRYQFNLHYRYRLTPDDVWITMKEVNNQLITVVQ
ncbi:MAG: DUF4361 domain-containing protein [Coprobacter sp.]|nr:DUF4361 domain-containing protein [Coprobacter sp.]